MKCYSLPYILRIKGEGEEGFYNCLPLQIRGGWGLLERRGLFEWGGGGFMVTIKTIAC